MWAMEAGRFFRFAQRLPAYQGVMRTVAEGQVVRERKRRGGADRVTPLTDARQLQAAMGAPGTGNGPGEGLDGLIDFG